MHPMWIVCVGGGGYNGTVALSGGLKLGGQEKLLVGEVIWEGAGSVGRPQAPNIQFGGRGIKEGRSQRGRSRVMGGGLEGGGAGRAWLTL